MTDRKRLTDAVVKAIPVPGAGYTTTHDAHFKDGGVRGLCVRTTCNGVKSFVLNYYIQGRDRSYTVGKFPEWGTAAARAEAVKLRRMIEEGGDPLSDKVAKREAPTMSELADRFDAEHLSRKRPSTAKDYRGMLKIWIRPHFGQTKVAAVEYADIDRLHRKITRDGSPYAANRCIAVLSKMFSLAVRWGVIEKSPANGIEKNPEHHRRRYLSGDELGRLMAALNEHQNRQAANAVRLLLFTGARRSEALGARWGDIDFGKGIWSKPPSSTTQNAHHEAHLSGPALALLDSIRKEQGYPKRPLGEYVFPSSGESGHLVEIKKAWASILTSASIENLRLHDLRHSFASALVSSGSSLPLIGAMLGHASPQTTARYSHMFDDPMKAAAERVAKLIENAGRDSTPDNVVTIKGGRS